MGNLLPETPTASCFSGAGQMFLESFRLGDVSFLQHVQVGSGVSTVKSLCVLYKQHYLSSLAEYMRHDTLLVQASCSKSIVHCCCRDILTVGHVDSLGHS